MNERFDRSVSWYLCVLVEEAGAVAVLDHQQHVGVRALDLQHLLLELREREAIAGLKRLGPARKHAIGRCHTATTTT